METDFKVKTEKFEGPLDVLLELIEKRKLLINEISLAKVTDDYISYIKSLGQFPLGAGAHFILIASTLLLIKSKSLLPSLNLTEEEQGSIDDLERRLKLYQKMKELSVGIKKMFGHKILFPKQPSKLSNIVFSPDNNTNISSLFNAVKDVLKNLPKKEFLPKAVIQKVISLEEMIGNLTKRITSSLRMTFKEFANISKGDKVNIIVSFLAMLELVKQGIISVKQEKDFDDIHMETNHINTPQYN